MDKIYSCTVAVTWRVKDTLTPYTGHNPLSSNGTIVGFTLPDGLKVRPIIGLEVESKDGKFKDLSHESQFAKLGFIDMDYDMSEFDEDEERSEKIEHEAYEDMPIENLPANLEPRFDSTREIIERRLKEGK